MKKRRNPFWVLRLYAKWFKLIEPFYKRPPKVRLTEEQMYGIRLIRKYLYDSEAKIYMSPDYERFIEKYEFFDKEPTYFIYVTDGGIKTRKPGFSGIEVKNHKDQFMIFFTDEQLTKIYEEIDEEIRRRRIEMYDIATKNVVNRLKELTENKI